MSAVLCSSGSASYQPVRSLTSVIGTPPSPPGARRRSGGAFRSVAVEADLMVGVSDGVAELHAGTAFVTKAEEHLAARAQEAEQLLGSYLSLPKLAERLPGTDIPGLDPPAGGNAIEPATWDGIREKDYSSSGVALALARRPSWLKTC
jgi:hypothetical protein